MSWLDDILGSDWLGPAALGAGVGLNIPSWISQMQAARAEEERRKLLMDPSRMWAMAQPIAAQQMAAIAPMVAGNLKNDLAGRGLSDAPGFAAKALGGALAPYQAQAAAQAMNWISGNIQNAPQQPSFPGFNPMSLLAAMETLKRLRGQPTAQNPWGSGSPQGNVAPDFSEAMTELDPYRYGGVPQEGMTLESAAGLR